VIRYHPQADAMERMTCYVEAAINGHAFSFAFSLKLFFDLICCSSWRIFSDLFIPSLEFKPQEMSTKL